MTASHSESAQALQQAQSLHQAGKLPEAEKAYRELTKSPEHSEAAHQGIFNLSMQSGRIQQAVQSLVALIDIRPDSLTYHAHLTEIMKGIGQPEMAIAYYQRMLQRYPDLADAHFSVGLLYKRVFRYREARKAYERALELGIRGEEEVHTNLGVLFSDMRDADKARASYERALKINATYQPALLNLAGLEEECGERTKAIELYERVLAENPEHWDALSRVAQCTRPESEDEPIFERLQDALGRKDVVGFASESLYFSLGRLLDAVGQYESAFDAYSRGNALNRDRSGSYERELTEKSFDHLMEIFDDDWLTRNTTRSTESPIFVCGMYRSGSTLVEQMLGQHAEVTAGGELDFLPWLISRNLSPYPEKARQLTPGDLQRIGDAYLSKSRELFPDARHFTDKRPDNFLHLGLVRAMYPQARIVYTTREMRDNCLSILFQPLGKNLRYSTDFDDAIHYYQQQEKLMRHWQELFGDRIFAVDYDEMVRDPEPVLRGVLDFLGLEWDESCLNFDRSGGPVKTASLWQVREGLHQSSSGRWKNYQAFIPSLQ